MRAWGVVALFTLGAMGACGGSTSADGTAGVGGGTGGAGGGISNSGGTSGTGGGPSLCQQGCAKLGAAACPIPYDLAQCTADCVQVYQQFPQCKQALDETNICIIGKAQVACDESGQAAFVNAQDVCAGPIDEFVNCAAGPGTGGAGGVSGSAGVGGSGGCGVCQNWKLGGLLDMKGCCTSIGCGALVDSTISQIATLPQGCYPLAQPGNLECNCPPHEFVSPINNEKEQYPGCCQQNGICGYWVDFTEAEGPFLGCITSWSAAAPKCMQGPPNPCLDAGTGG